MQDASIDKLKCLAASPASLPGWRRSSPYPSLEPLNKVPLCAHLLIHCSHLTVPKGLVSLLFTLRDKWRGVGVTQRTETRQSNALASMRLVVNSKLAISPSHCPRPIVTIQFCNARSRIKTAQLGDVKPRHAAIHAALDGVFFSPRHVSSIAQSHSHLQGLRHI